MNVKTMTVEELLGQKKSIHLSGFQYMLGELRSTLQRIAVDGKADQRLLAEKSRSQCLIPVSKLVDSILDQSRAVFLKHRELNGSRYADDEVFSALLGEMEATKARARSKLRLWLEDSSQILTTVHDMPLLHAHRTFIGSLERRVASDPPEQRASTALGLCKLLSLLVTSVDETNELGENPLIQAVANGHGVNRSVVALLAQAGVNLEATDLNGNTAASAAAWRGEAEVLRALGAFGADLQRANPLGFAPLHLAVSRGHLEAARALVELGSSVNAAAHDGSTPLLLAVVNNQPEIIAWFIELRAAAGHSVIAPSGSAKAAITAQPLAAALAVSRFNKDYYCNVWQCVLHRSNGGGGGRLVSVHFSVFGSGALGPLQGAAQSRLAMGSDDIKLPMVCPCFVTETPYLIAGTLTYALPDTTDDAQPIPLMFAFGSSGYSAVEVHALPQPSRQQQPEQAAAQHHLPPVVDVGAVDLNGRTALVAAAENGRADLVRLLILLGADPNAADRRGVTPSQAAAGSTRLRRDVTAAQTAETLQALTELGARVPGKPAAPIHRLGSSPSLKKRTGGAADGGSAASK